MSSFLKCRMCFEPASSLNGDGVCARCEPMSYGPAKAAECPKCEEMRAEVASAQKRGTEHWLIAMNLAKELSAKDEYARIQRDGWKAATDEHYRLLATNADLHIQLADRDARDELNVDAIHALQDQVRQLRDAYAGLRGRLGELVKKWRDEEHVSNEWNHGYEQGVCRCAMDLESAIASTAPGEQSNEK